jgi:murein DD-endopeptidase MepM/ murein hydrolase activator NlpD
LLPNQRSFLLIRVAIICIFCLQIFCAFAQSSQVHTVKKGDNLYQLAKKYNVTVDQIKKANNLKSINLSLGQKLKIPGTAVEKQTTSKSKKKTTKKNSKSEAETTDESTPKKQTKTSFPDFNRMADKKPGLAEGLFQKTKEFLGEKSTQPSTETQQIYPEIPANTSTDILPIPKDGYHVVKAKENLFRISKTYGLDMKEIMALNNMDNYSIKKGQKIKLISDEKLEQMQDNQKQSDEEEKARKLYTDESKVPDRITVEKDTLDLVVSLHVVQRHETLSSISRKYNIPVNELKKTNNLSSNKIFTGQKLYLKVRGKKQPETQIESSPQEIPELKDPSRIRNDLARPVAGHIMSEFGLRQNRPHKGLDLGAPSGTPIYAVLDGKVVYSGMQSGYGNVIVLEHPDFVMTVYAHNERNLVSVGDVVEKGQQIAIVGQTGNATAPHLHFEYRIKGKAIDPKKVLPE